MITLIAFATFFITSFLLLPLDSQLKSIGYGIVEYELAFTVDNASKMLQAWGTDGQRVMRDSLFLDYPFLLSYGLAFSGLTLLIWRRQTGMLSKLGLILVPTALIAAGCDSAENMILLTTLGQDAISAISPPAAGICASIKFLLLIIVIIYWIMSGIAWSKSKIDRDNSMAKLGT